MHAEARTRGGTDVFLAEQTLRRDQDSFGPGCVVLCEAARKSKVRVAVERAPGKPERMLDRERN
ncbi:hypothetical protein ACFRMN_13905 [Streptomyces sp. NPDC056835]|uniref:hypothetical protein n=1 Tax=Streptomyces sp. NPDC056835 TaxID=3345956 RepID=UPI0036AC970C